VDDRQLLDSHVAPDAEALARIGHEFREGFALIDRIEPILLACTTHA